MPYSGKADGRVYELFLAAEVDPAPVQEAGKLYCKMDGSLAQLYWCRNDGEIIPVSSPDHPVNSVFGRTGDIAALAGDYDTDLVTNASNVVGATCSDALNQLDSDLTALVGVVSAQAGDIAANTADIATNAADIAANTADIAANTADIATNTSDITDNSNDIATNAANIATQTARVDALDLLITSDYSGAGPHTPVLSDKNKLIRVSHGSAVQLIVPRNATVAYALGTVMPVVQWGAGTLTITPEDGTVTVRSKGGLMSASGQYAQLTLIKVDTNEWLLTGDRA